MVKILVVDDSETMREQLLEDLQGDGYEVLQAENGEQGIKSTQDNDIDLIITDFNMPIMDGLSMCIHINEGASPMKPIFMLTTQSRPDLKLKAKESGVLAWIIKPYNKDSLLKAVAKVYSK